MELTIKQVKRCNTLLYTVSMFLCAVYIANVPMYWFILKQSYVSLGIITVIIMGLSTVVYRLCKEKYITRYVISGLFFIAYVYTLFLFKDLCYYNYIFALMIAAIFYLEKS